MISMRVLLLLLGLAIAVVNGQDDQGANNEQPEEPDCSACEYNHNIGYYRSRIYCSVYWVCRVNPYKSGHYKSELMCCPPGQMFDPEHLTCTWLLDIDFECNPSRDLCPEFTTVPYEEFLCPYERAFEPCENDLAAECVNPKYYISVVTNQVFKCAFGAVWVQSICGCDYGEEFHQVVEGCKGNRRQILDFDFTDDFDSFVCNNFASGIPYGNAIIAGNTLCLDGQGSYLQIPFLYNWFAWNDIAWTFTLCFNFRPASAEEQGIFATHCKYEFETTLAPEGEETYPHRFIDIFIKDGVLQLKIAGNLINTNIEPDINNFQSMCVTYEHGYYFVTYNGDPVTDGEGKLREEFAGYPINSHSAAALGFVPAHGYFTGYIDDFSFWTYVDDDLVNDFVAAEASNNNDYTAPPVDEGQ